MYASTKAHIAYIYDRFPATFCVAPALQNPPIAYHRAARSVSDGGTAELLPRVDVCMNHWPIFIAMRSLWDRGRRSVRDYLLEKGRGDTGKPVETDCLIECLLVVQRYCRNLMFFFFFFFFIPLFMLHFVPWHLKNWESYFVHLWLKIYHFEIYPSTWCICLLARYQVAQH